LHGDLFVHAQLEFCSRQVLRQDIVQFLSAACLGDVVCHTDLDFMGVPPVTLPASAWDRVLTALSILITTPAAYCPGAMLSALHQFWERPLDTEQLGALVGVNYAGIPSRQAARSMSCRLPVA